MRARSFLFVPGNRPERFDKACQAGADCVIIDLEDAVAPPDKLMAREAVRQWLAPGKEVFVRLNGADTDWFDDDLELMGLPGLAGIVLPKAESREQIDAVRSDMKLPLPIIPLIETASGLWHCAQIAASPGVVRLAFGSVDFQLDLGISGDHEELLFARSQLVLVSRVKGLLPPVDGVTVALDDEAALAADIRRARNLGFGGKLCIHPKQVAPINAGFRPQAAELAWARQVVEAARNSGDNAVRLEGKLIDRPVIERARALIANEDAG
ncbi:MAG: CoA ester lyase [Proteobacteria bacterium]|nr:CoA ester lyase [Pseudomonadota bacterium]